MTLTIKGLSVTKDSRRLVDDVSIELSAGLNILVGPNGAGKSTLLKAIAGLVGFEGVIEYDNGTPKTSLLSQTPNVVSRMTASQYIELVDAASEFWKLGRRSNNFEGIQRALASAGVGHLSQCDLDKLSGGEFAKVRIARAIYQDASVVLLDEPFSGVDLGATADLMRLIVGELAGKTVLCVMHDLSLASRFASQILLMSEGQLLAHGTPAEVFRPELLSKVYHADVSVNWSGGQAVVAAR